MKALAQFIMRGYSQAALVAAVTAVLSLLMPLVGMISSAAVGLMTLRNGARPGFLLMTLATLGAGVFSVLALGSPWPAVGVLLVFWLPVWGLAITLRVGRSLGLTIQLAGLCGALLIFALHLALDDPAAQWLRLLESFRESLVQDGLIPAESSQAVFAELARWMTGAFAAGLVLQLLASLFLARWWQAALYNPGGFGEEFRSFRLARSVGVLFVGLLGWAILAKGAGVAGEILPLLAILLLLQGLAVIHEVRRVSGARVGWLVGLYVLMVLFMPQTVLLVACVGAVDIWADLRVRVARRISG